MIHLSVVMTVRNRPDYLAQCVGGLFEQDYDPAKYEIVVVDDGSDDGQTPDVVMGLARSVKLPAIKDLYLKKRSGPGVARNHGNNAAAGGIIVVQDSDDISLPNRLTKIAAFFAANPGVHVFFSGAYGVNADLHNRRYHGADMGQYASLERHQDIWHPTMAYKKAILGKAVAYPEDPADVDYGFLLAAKAAGYRFGCIDEALVLYRQHPGQISQCDRRLQHVLAAQKVKNNGQRPEVAPPSSLRRRVRQR